jgi:hypothetical protein
VTKTSPAQPRRKASKTIKKASTKKRVDAFVRSSSCHGSKKLGYRHHRDCRPGRPLCAAMRAINPKRRACGCDAYHFPHRVGSGVCGNAIKRWARDYNMSVDEVEKLCQAAE